MTRRAINRRLPLRVASKAIAHVQADGAHRGRLLQQIAVAGRAGNARLYMWLMIELHMSRGAVVVNAHPGDIFPACLVRGHFPDFRPVFSNHQMATHAEFHTGNGRVGTLIDASVADLALQATREMHVMRECDRLRRLSGMAVQEVTDRGPHAAVRGGENSACCRLRRACS